MFDSLVESIQHVDSIFSITTERFQRPQQHPLYIQTTCARFEPAHAAAWSD